MVNSHNLPWNGDKFTVLTCGKHCFEEGLPKFSNLAQNVNKLSKFGENICIRLLFTQSRGFRRYKKYGVSCFFVFIPSYMNVDPSWSCNLFIFPTIWIANYFYCYSHCHADSIDTAFFLQAIDVKWFIKKYVNIGLMSCCNSLISWMNKNRFDIFIHTLWHYWPKRFVHLVARLPRAYLFNKNKEIGALWQMCL